MCFLSLDPVGFQFFKAHIGVIVKGGESFSGGRYTLLSPGASSEKVHYGPKSVIGKFTGQFPLENHHPQILRANQIEDISHIISGKQSFCMN